MSNPIEQRRKADAWVQGYLFGYYLNRGYSIAEATELARGDVPGHLVEDVPVWNPYDPQMVAAPYAEFPDEEDPELVRERHAEVWRRWMEWITPTRTFTVRCLECGVPREIVPNGTVTQCLECGSGFITGP